MQLRFFISLVAFSAMCGCGSVKRATSEPSGTRFDLTADGTDFDWVWVEGKPIVLRAFHGNAQVGAQQQASITQGAFSVTFPQVVTEGVAYHVRYYIDRDDDGGCNDLDPGYTLDVTGLAGNTNITFPPLDPNAAQSVCSWF